MWSTGGSSTENFLVVSDAWARLISHFTPQDATVLDVGCGCGRAARTLINNNWIRRYIGFDVIEQNIKWCEKFVAPFWQGAAEFHWYDLYSAEYNPAGVMRAQDLRFPAGDRSIDVAFAASLFTHLLEPDARHYLKEVGRVLSPRGTAILSIHNEPTLGQKFTGTEARMDIESDYFAEIGADAGLAEEERIPDFAGQQVFIFRRRE